MILIIDYAHTADGMNKLIDAVQPFVKQKLIFLVGMAGERDLTKTPEMGRVACRADYVIFSTDNPANDAQNVNGRISQRCNTSK